MTSTARTAIRERPGSGLHLPDEISVLHSDIPVGMTLGEYRRGRTRTPSRTRNLLRRR
jgi:hypothetical protein